MPNLILPIYTCREHLDRFITQLESILKSSNVSSQYWLTYLKQQTQQDNHAYDAICEAETANSLTILGPDVSKTSPAEFTKLYQTCVTALKTKRGKLAGSVYTMQQQPNESVADFAHRFTETQHELEKLLPKIHRAADADGNDEVELIYSFSIKLKKSISKDLMSRDFKYKTLQQLISAAQRYELHSETLSGKDYEDLSAWGLNNADTPEPVAVYYIQDPCNLGLVLVTFHRTLVTISIVIQLVVVGPSLANIILEIGLIVIFNITLQLQEIQINLFLVLQVHLKFVICLTNLRNQHVSFLTTSVFTSAYTNVRHVRNGAVRPAIISPQAKLILISLRPNIRVRLM